MISFWNDKLRKIACFRSLRSVFSFFQKFVESIRKNKIRGLVVWYHVRTSWNKRIPFYNTYKGVKEVHFIQQSALSFVNLKHPGQTFPTRV